ncbi:O-acetyl-ADP-ribose deacetylase [Dysgonomonas sp. Marseille-P4677]|uniref:O-acetyl-ADP-ribose deacetylase n=1 Tax=Dysgonomonas sp. Marseille-P4677 TaxID=2364790 RepID=UPI001912F599|nr:O-acetyl-ADP-ribose deacetylase [Dysgonomonas sp. Marseille-P4677]MBK5721429.1 O-acetyl-ADP-ribose deacetylase [Dysgonomonas sp. Marseille-P4677]
MKAKIKLIKGDITLMAVDAIVNAANSSLLGGGGVDGAIHRKGGSQILEECKAIRNRQGKCKTGDAVYTSAGLLPAKYVIHTVGPIWNGGRSKEPELLASCYRKSLEIADFLQVRTIVFPNISTGVYHFPKTKAAQIAIDTIKEFVNSENSNIEEVIFVCFDDENYRLYESILGQ